MNHQTAISIFIVEDNFLYTYMLESALKEHGNFKVTAFATGEECLELLDNNPDIIILDHLLGKGMNGLATFKIIHSRKPKIPIIILSCQTDAQVAIDTMKAGAYDYIQKQNYSIGELEKTLLKAIRGN
ncbi:MAG: hypothetical protein A3F72_05940 [Bacteroidetes bacterium RIFCSPLOWO2_12_FULL_35_15]|nr:MAG: hypothetical protein A3F72_05940 [Bacteroidetes bacterium RIFCSPLOWO2_12_FULL_35_15]